MKAMRCGRSTAGALRMQPTSLRSRLNLVPGMIGAFCVVAIASSANAACYTGTQMMPPQSIGAFKADPAGLLQRFPMGGAQLISQIRDLAASDPATLDQIVALLASANRDQKSAI